MSQTAPHELERRRLAWECAGTERDARYAMRTAGSYVRGRDLRKLPLYRNVSLRLLQDLARIGGEEPLSNVDAARVSPLLLRSLAATRADRPLARGARCHLHAMFLTAEHDLDAPLEALALLLGAAIAKQFLEPSAVLILGDPAQRLWVWNGEAFVRVGLPRLHGPLDEDRLVRVLAPHGDDLLHLVVAHPRSPRMLPRRFARLKFHKVIAIVRRPPDMPPAYLGDLLRPEVMVDGEPCFSSFVPTEPLSGGSRLVAQELRTRRVALDPEDAVALAPRPIDRLRRDHCRLRFDLRDLTRRWQAWTGSAGEFPSALLRDRQLSNSCDRWARAVTNRRVGIALSGGGASTYRLVPFLQALEDSQVPVDVVSGVSGGALLGAYYCKDGRRGLERCIARGSAFQLGVLLAPLDTRGFRWLIDRDLENTAVDDLEVTFVPLTTALRHGRPPEPHVVTGGTLGQAVCASGAAPVLFAPTEVNGTRYADGATSAPVPAQVLPQFGADMVIACNCVPGPAERNPFAAWTLGELAYRYTGLGRIIDLWISTSGLLERVSREAAADAHVFVDFKPTRLPLVESFRFYDSLAIARAAGRDPDLAADARYAAARWMEFAWNAWTS